MSIINETNYKRIQDLLIGGAPYFPRTTTAFVWDTKRSKYLNEILDDIGGGGGGPGGPVFWDNIQNKPNTIFGYNIQDAYTKSQVDQLIQGSGPSTVYWVDVLGKPPWIGPSKPSYTAAEVGALSINAELFSGNYQDLANKPILGSIASKNSIAISDINATGSASSTTFLAGDGVWRVPSGGDSSSAWGSISGNIAAQTDLANALNNKVDVLPGKQLSSEDYTPSEKSKLSGIESGAQVNPTASQIKQLYESNADTNAYTDAEKNKLASAITSETDPTVPSWAKQPDKPSYTKSEVGLTNVDNIQQATKSEFISHDSDSVRHITAQERSNWNAAAGSGLSLGETSTTAYRGDRGVIAYNHSQETHAPTNAQKNSDITKAEIEAKLTGAITSHTHSAYVPTSRTVAGKALSSNISLVKADVGLGNVDNTSDANKPVSTAQQAALDSKQDTLIPGSNITITEGTISAVDTTYGVATTSVNGLMSSTDKSKLNGIATGANNYTHPSSHPASMITQTSSYRFVTDAEKSTWNAKSNLALGSTSATAYRGDRGTTAYNHSQEAHAPSDAQKNSDITKAEIEAKLTGAVTTHTHSTAQISDFPEKGNLIAGDNISITESGNNITIASTGGGTTIHNDLTGRETANAHPISAITGLQSIADNVTNANTLVAGTNVTLTPSGSTLVISAAGGGGGATVHGDLTGRETANSHPIGAITGLGAITDQVLNAGNLIAGNNITLTPSGADVTISASSSGGGSSDWADITNKPATFLPSAHTHSADDIASGTLNIARIPTGTTASTVSLGNHTHTVANITGLETTLTGLENSVDNASNLVAGNNITLTPSGSNLTISASGGLSSVAWEDITDKPSTFAPSTHTHPASVITQDASNRFVTDAEKSTWNSKQDSIGTGTTSQFLRGDGTWVTPPNDNTTYSGSASITLAGSSFQRSALTGDVTSPLNSNVTTLSNSGVVAGTYNTGTTSIQPFTVDAKGRITSVGMVATITPAWGSVTGKPSTFAPSAHNHAAGEITSGTLDIGRIPTGTTASTVALGNHGHTVANISGLSGTLDALGDSIDNASTLVAGTNITLTPSGNNVTISAADTVQFEVVTELPASPLEGVFYFVKE